jgi:hypothetical protein
MRWFKLIIIALVALLITSTLGCATTNTTNATSGVTINPVYAAAGLDTVTTAVALNRGAHELNPLGFLGATVAKIIYLSRRDSLDPTTRLQYDRIATSVWTGAGANNFIQIITPVPILYSIAVGFMVGYSIYTSE